MSITQAIRAPWCAVLSRHGPKNSLALGQHYSITCIPSPRADPEEQVPKGAALPHRVISALPTYTAPHSSRASRAGTPSPPRAAAEQNWGAPVPCREHQYRGNTVIPTPWWRLQCQQNLPQSLFLPAASQPPGRCSRNVAGKAVSIHSPEALLASPSPAKRMRAHTQIKNNLCFNIACKCTAEC